MGRLLERYEEIVVEDQEYEASANSYRQWLFGEASKLESDLKSDLKALGLDGITVGRTAQQISLHHGESCMKITPVLEGEYRIGFPTIEDRGFFRLQKANEYNCGEREMLDGVLRWFQQHRS